MKAIILFGAPGSGKGTTAERIRTQAGLIHIATGDMLRAAVKNGTELGREAEGYMKKGSLVPDDVIIRMVEERLDKGKADDAYLFDGFPRTIPQAELLEKSLERRGGSMSHVFFLETPREIIMDRLTGRRTCRKCNATYHVRNIPPKTEGVCDVCGGELYQRVDDKAETISNRLDVFTKETAALILRYEKQGVLVRVNSDQGADNLAREILVRIQADGRGRAV